jgi:hypothetical protein
MLQNLGEPSVVTWRSAALQALATISGPLGAEEIIKQAQERGTGFILAILASNIRD